MSKRYTLLLAALAMMMQARAQQFFALSPEELQIDSELPMFTCIKELGTDYADSTYEVSIEYPEYVPMKRREIRRYRKVAGNAVPETLELESYTGVSRRKGSLYVSLIPFVRQDGKNMKLTSFKLNVKASAKKAEGNAKTQVASQSPAYAYPTETHSRLATGKWVKISIPSSGFYELTDSFLLAAGFTDPQQVKVYGYGGALQPEQLYKRYLYTTDDLPQVPVCNLAGRKLFYGEGTVTWASATTKERTRNHYADEGCYFLSDNDQDQPLLRDSAQFVAAFYPSFNDYHSLYEVDDFSWYHGGRNLYDARLFGTDVERTYKLPSHPSTEATLTIFMSYSDFFDASVIVADSVIGIMSVNKDNIKGSGRKQYPDSYSKAAADVWSFPLSDLTADSLAVTIRQTSGANMRLDYISVTFGNQRPLPDLAATLPQPRLIGEVANQNHHADTAADMVIIIPASGELLEQAERLAQLHREYDALRVRVVKADEFYNEFSSGTPDANAYRRYMRMLYERAQTEADMPRYLLLFGDGAYDNRMHLSDFSQFSPDDFLLCYESENSFSETACFVTDDYFGMLDDGEGSNIIKIDKGDIAIGRFPVRRAEEAKTMVDKAYDYRLNNHAGAWQNTICMMGDDGNANMHMNDAESVASLIASRWPAYNVKKIYWDAYERVTSARGFAFPDVTNLIRQQMLDGALLMNYSGHGAAYMLSHEYVVDINDFKASTSMRLPVWFTASCDVAPFDGGSQEDIGEQAVFNKNGGAIAFIGTTRTVYATHNRKMNRAFTEHVLETVDGEARSIGEALCMAKNDQVLGSRTQVQAGTNRLHFVLLGDPALKLPIATHNVVVDSINGTALTEGNAQLVAGDTAVVVGHIEGNTDFNGVATLTVKDAELTIVCRMNPQDGDEMPKEPLVYQDRPTTLFVGSDSVSAGRFAITFAVPKDISYSDDPGQMLVHAVSDDRNIIAHGHSEAFTMCSADSYDSEGTGPAIIAWLDTPQFEDGQVVSATPHLHAELTDEDGINISDGGLGHAIELTIDGLMRYTYNLNSYFTYDFGDFRNGTIDFTLPRQDEGRHELQLRAWDVLNNSSVRTLTYVVGQTGDPSGIEEITNLKVQSSKFKVQSSNPFDLSGRPVSSTPHRALLLYRTKDGKVKKLLVRGNK